MLQLEKTLREIAKIGVIKLTDEVRDARTSGGEGSKVLGSEGVVGIAEKSMVCLPHTGLGIGTDLNECYIDRNVETWPLRPTQLDGNMTTSGNLIPTTYK